MSNFVAQKQNSDKMAKFIAIIPARYASSRFPGKPLADICGISMIERVYRRTQTEVNDVWVATDDTRIADAVKAFGGNVVMTSSEHRSGTDRIAEAYRLIGSDADVVINVQGDEPFIDPSQLREIKACFDDSSTDIATLGRPFDPAMGFDALFDPNKVKVIFGADGRAIYFSRAIIPYIRNYKWDEWLEHRTFYIHVGMYAYRANVLAEITKLPQSSLEIAESLEQLRWIENGYTIRVGVTQAPTIGIDTPEDLEEACRFCKENNL